MIALARFLVARAPLVLAATALVTLAAIAMLPRLAFNADVTSFLLDASAAGRELAALQAKYDAADPITVLLEREDGGTFGDRDGLVLLAQTRDALQEVDGVAWVGAAIPDQDPLFGRPLTPEVIGTLPGPILSLLVGGPASDLLIAEDGR